MNEIVLPVAPLCPPLEGQQDQELIHRTNTHSYYQGHTGKQVTDFVLGEQLVQSGKSDQYTQKD